MTITVDDMVQSLKQREAARAARAQARADRLLSRLPDARRLLVDEHGATRAWLFGSLATGPPRETSDVDLGVEGLDGAVYFRVLADLMTTFGAPVDLVRLEEAPTSLRERILAEGRPL